MYIVNRPNFERNHLANYGKIPANLEYPSCSMSEMMLESCKKYKKILALKYTQRGLTHQETFEQFAKNIEKAARLLKQYGTKKGDRILLPYLPESLHLVYAILAVGAILVPLHPNETKSKKRMAEILREIHPRILFCLDSSVQDLNMIMAENQEIDHFIKKVFFIQPVDALKKKGLFSLINIAIDYKYAKTNNTLPLLHNHKLYPNKFIHYYQALKISKDYQENYLATVYGEDEAVILYSSGTSGKRPDACIHTHNSFNSLAISGYHICDCIAPGQKLIAVPGLFHGFGLGTATHTLLNQGVTHIIVPNPKDLQYLAETQKRENAEIHINVPLLLTKMKESGLFEKVSFSNTELFICGGGICSRNTIGYWNEKLPQGIAVREGYGSTQMVGGTCINLRTKCKPYSIGVPLPDYYYKLIHPETNKLIRSPYTTGEAWVAGPSLMKGVLHSSSPNTLVADCDGVIWYKTNDLMQYDEEGFYYFIDRADDVMVMSNGNLVNPYDIRIVLEESGIDNTIIFKYTNNLDEKIVVCVDNTVQQEVLKAMQGEIKNAFKNSLKSYEIPHEIIRVNTVPMSLNGKPLVREIITLYRDEKYNFKLELKS